jgi:hypothetical protein
MDPTSINHLILLELAREELQEGQSLLTGQPGHEYVKELLQSAHPQRVFQVLRMQLPTFYSLRDWLLQNISIRGDSIMGNNLRTRGRGTQLSIEEKLVIFLYIVSRGASGRDTSERFSRGRMTITQ